MCVFGIWIAILSYIFGRLLNFVQDVKHFRKTYSFRNSKFTILFGFGFDKSSRILKGCRTLGIQMGYSCCIVLYLCCLALRRVFSCCTRVVSGYSRAVLCCLMMLLVLSRVITRVVFYTRYFKKYMLQMNCVDLISEWSHCVFDLQFYENEVSMTRWIWEAIQKSQSAKNLFWLLLVLIDLSSSAKVGLLFFQMLVLL